MKEGGEDAEPAQLDDIPMVEEQPETPKSFYLIATTMKVALFTEDTWEIKQEIEGNFTHFV